MKEYFVTRLTTFLLFIKLAQCSPPHQNVSETCISLSSPSTSLQQLYKIRVQDDRCNETSISVKELETYFKHRNYSSAELDRHTMGSFDELCQGRGTNRSSSTPSDVEMWCGVFDYYEKKNRFTATLKLPVQLLSIEEESFDIFQFLSHTNGSYSLWSSFLNRV